MVVGAVSAGIAGLLRVTSGVYEVISTIMLNEIAGLLVGYLIAKVGVSTGNSTQTKGVPKESWIDGITLFDDSPTKLYGLILLAVVAGIGFQVLLNRTTFGFNLRATGISESAAVAAGVDGKRMVVISMLLSGAVAGAIGMPGLCGQAHNYGTSFQLGVGFSGIAVALLGRNNPVGIAFGALIFAYTSEQAGLLNILVQISPEIVAVTQGIIVLAVVIAYEVVRRYKVRLEQATAAAQMAPASGAEVTA
jgi:simple sugar transport system permease protein